MAEFKEKNNNSFWHSPIVLLVLFCILILFIYNMVDLFEKERETSKKKELILSKIETLRARENTLSVDIEKLKTAEGVEEMIRDKFQVVKEGEKMVVIVDEDKKIEQQLSIVEDHSFWGWIKNIFKR